MIVHCAAERRPDVVDSQPDAASQLNVAASGNIAKEAGKKNHTHTHRWLSCQDASSFYMALQVWEVHSTFVEKNVCTVKNVLAGCLNFMVWCGGGGE